MLRVTGDVRNRMAAAAVGLAVGERGMLLPRFGVVGLAGVWDEEEWGRLVQRVYARGGAGVSGAWVAVGLVQVLLVMMLSSNTRMLTLLVVVVALLGLLGKEGSRVAVGGAAAAAAMAMSGGTGMREACEPKRLGEGHCRLHRVVMVAGRWPPGLCSSGRPGAGLPQL